MISNGEPGGSIFERNDAMRSKSVDLPSPEASMPTPSRYISAFSQQKLLDYAIALHSNTIEQPSSRTSSHELKF